MGQQWIIISIVICLSGSAYLLENGLSRTPPMGWLAWQRFRCNIDCVNDPENCISENLFKTMADLIVSEGYAALGYEYINIDDCWLEKERINGQLVADKERFPSGIKALSDYIHGKGLKFGIYQDYGNYTCAGYPGILGHLENDAKSFADWEVDYVKLDGCYSEVQDMPKGYPEFGRHLNQTGRPMVYSCSWPAYEYTSGIKSNYTNIIEHCNLWRNFYDIDDSWDSLTSVIDHYAENQDILIPNAGPGHWNDPDMLLIGNFGLNYEQSRTQMALWAILSAPLLMSVDLRKMRPENKAILQNRKIIAVNQDPLGVQGRRIFKLNKIEFWTKKISPAYQNYNSYAIAIVNRRTAEPQPVRISITLWQLGLFSPTGYHVEDLYTNVTYGVISRRRKIWLRVNPAGVVMLRADVQKDNSAPPQDRDIYIN